MTKVQRPIHVRVWECAHPFWKFLSDFSWRELLCLLGSGRIYFEDVLLVPQLLVFLFNCL